MAGVSEQKEKSSDVLSATSGAGCPTHTWNNTVLRASTPWRIYPCSESLLVSSPQTGVGPDVGIRWLWTSLTRLLKGISPSSGGDWYKWRTESQWALFSRSQTSQVSWSRFLVDPCAAETRTLLLLLLPPPRLLLRHYCCCLTNSEKFPSTSPTSWFTIHSSLQTHITVKTREKRFFIH